MSYGIPKTLTDSSGRAGSLAPNVNALSNAVDDLDTRVTAVKTTADRAYTVSAAAKTKNDSQDTTLGKHASRIGHLEQLMKTAGGGNVVIQGTPLGENEIAVGDLWINTDDNSLHHYKTQGFPEGLVLIGYLDGDTQVWATDADLAARSHAGDVWIHPDGKIRVRNEANTAWELRADFGGPRAHTIQNAGTALAQRPALDFLGEGVVASDDSVGNKTVVTITGRHTVQDEGTTVASRGTLNFVGAGVAVTDDATNGKTVVTIGSTGGGHTILHPTTSAALAQRSKLQIASPAGYFTANDDATNDITVLAFTNAAPGHKITAPGDPATVMAQRTKLNISGASGITVTAGDSPTDDVTSIVISGSGSSSGGTETLGPGVAVVPVGYWWGTALHGSAPLNGLVPNGDVYLTPITVTKATRITEMGIFVTTAAADSSIRLVLFNLTGDGLPGTLRYSPGSVATTATGAKTIVSDHVLDAGTYALGVQGTGTGKANISHTDTVHFPVSLPQKQFQPNTVRQPMWIYTGQAATLSDLTGVIPFQFSPTGAVGIPIVLFKGGAV